MKTAELRLRQKLNEVFILEPNDLGPRTLTDWYKKITVHLKTKPFIFIIPMSLLSGVGLYFILRQLLIRLVTLLQYGF